MYSSLYISNELIDIARKKNEYLTPMQLIKLVYISHGWSLGLNDRALVAEDIMAWKYGPVIPELYREIKSYKANKITNNIPISSNLDLQEVDKSLVKEVYEKYGKFTGIELSAITHQKGSPWSKTWEINPWGVIPDVEINNYYKELLASV
jgi:uncharacterized phage-associated protein